MASVGSTDELESLQSGGTEAGVLEVDVMPAPNRAPYGAENAGRAKVSVQFDESYFTSAVEDSGLTPQDCGGIDLDSLMASLPERRADSFLYAASFARCVPESNGLSGEFCWSMAGWTPQTSRPPCVWVALHFLGTLPAHRPAHDIAKLAIRRPGLADAGSAYRSSNQLGPPV